jgi:polyisoprenyl-phosphate glycosyltransferase
MALTKEILEFALQAFLIGVLGEYIGSIHTQVRNMPLVVKIERVNF